jgi:hypothetical protein
VGHTKTFDGLTILILVCGRGKVSVDVCFAVKIAPHNWRGDPRKPKKGTFGQNWPLNNDETDIISNDSFRKGVS